MYELGAEYCKSDKYRTILFTEKFKFVLGVFILLFRINVFQYKSDYFLRSYHKNR